jgi:hypothetical protein
LVLLDPMDQVDQLDQLEAMDLPVHRDFWVHPDQADPQAFKDLRDQ